MKTSIYKCRKCILMWLAAFPFLVATAQQEIIINKDNTRPETKELMTPGISQSLQASTLTISRHNGYNEIQWSATARNASNRYVLEYSYDGINFSTGGTVASSDGLYRYKHYSSDPRPMFYRLRVEDPLGKRYYFNTQFLDGEEIQPVKLYTNVISGNMINATAQFPVEKVIITSAEGSPVFSKDINGARDHIPIAIPGFRKGIYYISFYGNGWISTNKFVVG